MSRRLRASTRRYDQQLAASKQLTAGRSTGKRCFALVQSTKYKVLVRGTRTTRYTPIFVSSILFVSRTSYCVPRLLAMSMHQSVHKYTYIRMAARTYAHERTLCAKRTSCEKLLLKYVPTDVLCHVAARRLLVAATLLPSLQGS